MSESDDDIPLLSSETFASLLEFYSEQEKKEQKLKEMLEDRKEYQCNPFDEDWQLSQFWYNDETVRTLTSEIHRISQGTNVKIALISCPTLYKEVKKLCENAEVALFEYDNRFAAYGIDYNYYDYKSPLDISRTFANYFDIVVADPPFLSEECITKTAVTIRFIAKDKIILCTGTVMEELVQRLLHLDKSNFKPEHKNNLANEFSCYTNYKSNLNG